MDRVGREEGRRTSNHVLIVHCVFLMPMFNAFLHASQDLHLWRNLKQTHRNKGTCSDSIKTNPKDTFLSFKSVASDSSGITFPKFSISRC